MFEFGFLGFSGENEVVEEVFSLEIKSTFCLDVILLV